MARDSGRRRNTHALDAQACDLIELPSSAAKPAVRSRRVRAERAPADCAPVPLPSAGLCRERAVAHDVKARLSTVVTLGGSARHPIDRAHFSSVPGGVHDLGGKADRSTATGASTRSVSPCAASWVQGALAINALSMRAYCWSASATALRYSSPDICGPPPSSRNTPEPPSTMSTPASSANSPFAPTSVI